MQQSYTEENIQEYLDGTFTGDKKAFEKYIEENKAAFDTMQYYKMLYQHLNEGEEMQLSINLREAVISNVFKEKVKRKFPFISFIIPLVIAALCITIYKAFNFGGLVSALGNIDLLVFMSTLGFIITWHSVDWIVRKKKFEAGIDDLSLG